MTELDFVAEWARAFGVTLAVEAAVAVPLLRAADASLARRSVAVSLAQLATHPVVWFVLPAVIVPRALYLVLAETFAAVVEAVLYVLAFPALPRRRAFIVSVAANAASVTVGLVVRRLTGWV